MGAPIVRTEVPGIFSRGSRYVYSYRLNGKQKWEAHGTLREAIDAKARRHRELTPVRAEAFVRRMRDRARVQNEIERARAAKLAESRRTAAEAYSLVRKAGQALERAERQTPSREARFALKEAWRSLHDLEDSIGAAMRLGA